MLTLKIMPWQLSVAQLPIGESFEWVKSSAFYTVSRTPDELSVVCETSSVPPSITQQNGWRGFCVEGVLDFALVGILAKLSSVLADAGISIFAISTYNTDYILVKEKNLEPAIHALHKNGYAINPDPATSVGLT